LADRSPIGQYRRSRFCSSHFASAARLAVFLFSLKAGRGPRSRQTVRDRQSSSFETVSHLLDLIDQRMTVLALAAGAFPAPITVARAHSIWSDNSAPEQITDRVIWLMTVPAAYAAVSMPHI
jgi:hypothetical protein